MSLLGTLFNQIRSSIVTIPLQNPLSYIYVILNLFLTFFNFGSQQ